MRGKDTRRTEYTGGHLAVAKILEGMGFSLDHEISFAPYRVDMYIGSHHVAVEFDGAHTMKKRDKKRDEILLEKYRLPVLRVESSSPKEEVQHKFMAFIRNWNKDVSERKAYLWESCNP